MKKLPRLIEATRMLVCAEDLGMIPQCVPTVLNDLRILSLEVQSMPKEYGQRFGHPERYPYRSVCTIDSHDMPTLRMWWDEDYDRAQEYYSTILGRLTLSLHGWRATLCCEIYSQSPCSAFYRCRTGWLSATNSASLMPQPSASISLPTLITTGAIACISQLMRCSLTTVSVMMWQR